MRSGLAVVVHIQEDPVLVWRGTPLTSQNTFSINLDWTTTLNLHGHELLSAHSTSTFDLQYLFRPCRSD